MSTVNAHIAGYFEADANLKELWFAGVYGFKSENAALNHARERARQGERLEVNHVTNEDVAAWKNQDAAPALTLPEQITAAQGNLDTAQKNYDAAVVAKDGLAADANKQDKAKATKTVNQAKVLLDNAQMALDDLNAQ